ncbi:hypothetical protein RFI_27794, partial [Reticulomyxa filosa]
MKRKQRSRSMHSLRGVVGPRINSGRQASPEPEVVNVVNGFMPRVDEHAKSSPTQSEEDMEFFGRIHIGNECWWCCGQTDFSIGLVRPPNIIQARPAVATRVDVKHKHNDNEPDDPLSAQVDETVTTITTTQPNQFLNNFSLVAMKGGDSKSNATAAPIETTYDVSSIKLNYANNFPKAPSQLQPPSILMKRDDQFSESSIPTATINNEKTENTTDERGKTENNDITATTGVEEEEDDDDDDDDDDEEKEDENEEDEEQQGDNKFDVDATDMSGTTTLTTMHGGRDTRSHSLNRNLNGPNSKPRWMSNDVNSFIMFKGREEQALRYVTTCMDFADVYGMTPLMYAIQDDLVNVVAFFTLYVYDDKATTYFTPEQQYNILKCVFYSNSPSPSFFCFVCVCAYTYVYMYAYLYVLGLSKNFLLDVLNYRCPEQYHKNYRERFLQRCGIHMTEEITSVDSFARYHDKVLNILDTLIMFGMTVELNWPCFVLLFFFFSIFLTSMGEYGSNVMKAVMSYEDVEVFLTICDNSLENNELINFRHNNQTPLTLLINNYPNMQTILQFLQAYGDMIDFEMYNDHETFPIHPLLMLCTGARTRRATTTLQPKRQKNHGTSIWDEGKHTLVFLQWLCTNLVTLLPQWSHQVVMKLYHYFGQEYKTIKTLRKGF